MPTNHLPRASMTDFSAIDMWLRRWMAMLVIFGCGSATLIWSANILQALALWNDLEILIGGGLLGGGVVALFAGYALQRYLTHTSLIGWLVANSLGFTSGFLLMRHLNLYLPEQPLVWIFSATLCGVWIGLIQWWFLRSTLAQAFGWIVVTSTAWLTLCIVAMLISLGLD